MELRKIREGVWLGLWCLGTAGGPGLPTEMSYASKQNAMVTSSGLSRRGSRADLPSQPFIAHVEWPPLRGLRPVMTMDVS